MTPAHDSGNIWQPVGDDASSPLALLDGAEIGIRIRLAVETGPKNSVGARYFRAFLKADDVGRTATPILQGMVNRGPQPGFNWVEVTAYDDHPSLEDGRPIEIPEAVDVQVVRALAALVPPGGHLMMEYDSPARRLTAQALAVRVPPVATPLGAKMFAAGCGVAFRDWYIPEGGREGPRKLQGFRALDEAHARRRGEEMLRALDDFMPRSKELEWHVQGRVRELAQAAIAALHHRLELPEGPLVPAGKPARNGTSAARRSDANGSAPRA